MCSLIIQGIGDGYFPNSILNIELDRHLNYKYGNIFVGHILGVNHVIDLRNGTVIRQSTEAGNSAEYAAGLMQGFSV